MVLCFKYCNVPCCPKSADLSAFVLRPVPLAFEFCLLECANVLCCTTKRLMEAKLMSCEILNSVACTEVQAIGEGEEMQDSLITSLSHQSYARLEHRCTAGQ